MAGIAPQGSGCRSDQAQADDPGPARKSSHKRARHSHRRYSHAVNLSIRIPVDRRIHERHRADFQVQVTEVEAPDCFASGWVVEISQFGLGVYLPLQFMPGSVVRLNINDSVLYGFVTYSTPERSYFRTGIEVVQVLIGGSDLSLKATLEEVMPDVQWLETHP